VEVVVAATKGAEAWEFEAMVLMGLEHKDVHKDNMDSRPDSGNQTKYYISLVFIDVNGDM